MRAYLVLLSFLASGERSAGVGGDAFFVLTALPAALEWLAVLLAARV